MPWEERDWANWTDEERDRYLGSSGRGGSWSTTSTTPGSGGGRSRLNRPLSRGQTIFALALIAAFVAYAFHNGGLLIPDLTSVVRGTNPTGMHPPSAPRSVPSREVRMTGVPSTIRRGTYVTTRGTLGRDVSGVVIAEGRWRTGPWYRLATAPAENGVFRIRYLLGKPGLVHLRI